MKVKRNRLTLGELELRRDDLKVQIENQTDVLKKLDLIQARLNVEASISRRGDQQ